MVEMVAATLITNVTREKEIAMMLKIVWLDIVEEITAMVYRAILTNVMIVAQVGFYAYLEQKNITFEGPLFHINDL